MEEKVLDIILKMLKVDQETLRERFDQKDIWDSLMRVEVLFAIEDEFDIQFDEEELAELATPKKLYEAVLEKVKV